MDDDTLRAALLGVLDVDEPVIVRVRHEPHEAARRLLIALGAGWVVDERAAPCAAACGREECRVSEIVPVDHVRRPPASAGRVISTRADGPPWEPNWIDYRHSLVQVDRRRDGDDETLEICPYCECEVDVTPAPHKPGCKGLGAPRASSATTRVLAANEQRRRQPREISPRPRARVDGLDLLERMDAGEPVGDETGPAEVTGDPRGPRGDAGTPGPRLGRTAAQHGAEGGAQARVGGARPATSPAQDAVLALLAAGPKRMSEVARARGVHKASAWQSLNLLIERGLAVKVGRGLYALSGREPEAADATEPPAALTAVEPDDSRAASTPPAGTGRAPSRPDNTDELADELRDARAQLQAAQLRHDQAFAAYVTRLVLQAVNSEAARA